MLKVMALKKYAVFAAILIGPLYSTTGYNGYNGV